jgi:hypothetical protein
MEQELEWDCDLAVGKGTLLLTCACNLQSKSLMPGVPMKHPLEMTRRKDPALVTEM